MKENIPLVNIKKNIKRRTGDSEEENSLLENKPKNVKYMERHKGQFKSSTGFLKKIFYGISISILGVGSVFLVLIILRLFGVGGGGDTKQVTIENYINVLTERSNNSNLNIENGALLKPLLVERVVGTESHKQVQNFIVNHFKKLHWEVEKDMFEADTPYGKKEFTNYMFTKNPKAERRIVFAAHYDSKYIPNEVFIGATDSAVPCAILMDIAESLNYAFEKRDKRILKEQGEDGIRKSTTIQMIFFDGEEAFVNWSNYDSIYGAKHLAAKWELESVNDHTSTTKLQAIDVFVLLDLLGNKIPDSENPVFHNYYKSSESYFNSLAEVESILKNKNLLLTTSANSKNNSYFNKSEALVSTTQLFIDDDHKPFLHKNVPILHIIPYPFPDVWHKPSDDASALDEDTIKDFSLIFKLFVVKLFELNKY